jgi:hypothetical protein
MGSTKRGLWIGQGETIRLNVCYYRERPLAGFEDVLPLLTEIATHKGHSQYRVFRPTPLRSYFRLHVTAE